MIEAWLDPWTLVTLLAIGLAGGALGGMLGVGGSVVMIPALTLVFGFDQHLYQAAAMIANIAVSIPAMLRHRRAGILDPAVLRWMLPAAAVSVLIGVWLSNLPVFRGPENQVWLGRLLAVFLLYVIVVNILRLSGDAMAREAAQTPTITPARSGGIGGFMGLIGGLLGVGGGAVAVPLQQVLMRLPLKQCMAHSSAIICVSALIGSAYKNATLPLATDGIHSPWAGVMLGLLLSPTCWAGGQLGAAMLHRLPLRPVRVAFILLMLVSAWRMAAPTGA
jgi:uncharacterized membrane protein YfcA